MSIRTITLASATALLLPLSAFAADVRVTSAVLGEDYDTITVQLSAPAEGMRVVYDLYLHGNGYSYSGWSTEVRNGSSTLTGLRDQIVQPGGTGRGTMEIRVCSQDFPVGGSVCGDTFVLPFSIGAIGESFVDVSPAHPNADAVAYVHRRGLVAGYPDGTFKPDISINRAEFTKIITLAFHQQQDINRCTGRYFSDVPSDAWYGRCLCQARMTGLISGYPDGTFHPAQEISFVEASKIIVRGFGAYADCGGVHCTLAGDSAHPWYEAYVRGLEAHHAIPLTIRRFDQPITRGEMAEMLYRLSPGAPISASSSYDALLMVR